MKTNCILATLLAAGMATPALAHVTLDASTASVGASFKAVFRVPHGCAGQPTTAIKVQVPEGFVAVKPMPKSGWTISERSGDYRQEYKLFGTAVKSGIVEVDWTGGSLPDAYYDEFVLFGQLADSLVPGTRLYFPVVQECGSEAERWIMLPNDGQAEAPKTPAPSIMLTAPAGK